MRNIEPPFWWHTTWAEPCELGPVQPEDRLCAHGLTYERDQAVAS